MIANEKMLFLCHVNVKVVILAVATVPKIVCWVQLCSCRFPIFYCHSLCSGTYCMTFDLQCEWCSIWARVEVYLRSVAGRYFGATQGQLLSTSIVHFSWHHLSGHSWRACVIMHHSEDCFLYIILTSTLLLLLHLILAIEPPRSLTTAWAS